jgi:MFS family permease
MMIASGAALREFAPHSGLLLSSALLGGIGIGIIQALIPAVIKRQFPRRTPQVMGLWSAALMGGGGLGAAFTPWLAQHSAIWHHALPGGRYPPSPRCSAGGRQPHAYPPGNIRPRPGHGFFAAAARGRSGSISV